MKADPTKTHQAQELKHTSPLIGCRFDPTGTYLFAGAQDNSVVRWRLADGKKAEFKGHVSWVRGLAFAGLVPLLALGAVASYLAQRAIEDQVREDTVRTANGEADFLRRYVEDARESLQLLLDSPGFRTALTSIVQRALEVTF